MTGVQTCALPISAYKVGLFGWLAVALKKGFKLVIVAVVAIGAAIKNFFGKLFGGRKDNVHTGSNDQLG